MEEESPTKIIKSLNLNLKIENLKNPYRVQLNNISSDNIK
jgi:hypothetical protein